MQLRKGGFWFPVDAVSISRDGVLVTDAAGRPYAERLTLSARGRLFADGQRNVATASALLEQSLRVPYQDVVFHASDGSVMYGLYSALSLTGVICEPVSFPGTNGGFEFVSGREFAFRASAEFALPGSGVVYTSFSESLSFSGGGAVNDFIQPINGPPIPVTVFTATPFRVVQAGQATSLYPNPQPPAPIWPSKLLKSPNIQYGSARRVGLSFRDYPISWVYEFGSTTALAGVPNQWLS